MKNTYRLIQGECLHVLSSLPQIADLVVTSPPYFANKEYEHWDSYTEYLNFLYKVFRQLYLVLRPGSRLCINVDDKHTDLKTYGINKCWGTHARLIVELSNLYTYKDMIIWNKIRNAHASGGATYVLGSYPYPPEIPIITNYEYILIFRKEGQRNHTGDKENSKLTFHDFKTYGMGMWNVPAEKNRSHPAPFPEEIPRRLIKLFSFINDTVLDPFIGWGTTMMAAQNLARNCVGIEVEPSYCDLARKRCFGRTFLGREYPEYSFEVF